MYLAKPGSVTRILYHCNFPCDKSVGITTSRAYRGALPSPVESRVPSTAAGVETRPSRLADLDCQLREVRLFRKRAARRLRRPLRRHGRARARACPDEYSRRSAAGRDHRRSELTRRAAARARIDRRARYRPTGRVSKRTIDDCSGACPGAIPNFAPRGPLRVTDSVAPARSVKANGHISRPGR